MVSTTIGLFCNFEILSRIVLSLNFFMNGISKLDSNFAVRDLGLKVIFNPNASNNKDASMYLNPNSSLNLFEKSMDLLPIVIRFLSKLMV